MRLADQIYQQLLEQIIAGRLSVSDRLPSESRLCETFGVSRPVIRETLARLAADALVATRKGSGTIVLRRPDREVLNLAPFGEIADLMRCFEFRVALEGEAAGAFPLSCRTADDLDAIDAAMSELDGVIERGEVGVDADFRLHAAIARATKNNFFIEQLDSLAQYVRNGMHLTRQLSLARKRKRQVLVQDEHRDIVRAIIGQDDDAARNAMRIQVDNARKRALDDSAETDLVSSTFRADQEALAQDRRRRGSEESAAGPDRGRHVPRRAIAIAEAREECFGGRCQQIDRGRAEHLGLALQCRHDGAADASPAQRRQNDDRAQ